MNKILLDFIFPITSIEPTQQASTAFLKQALVVVKPKVAIPTGVVTLCTSMAQVAALTDNTEAEQLFNAGLSRVYIVPMDDLNLSAVLNANKNFYTVLISSDFDKDDIIASYATLTVSGDLKFDAKTLGYEGNDISITYTTGATSPNEVVSVVGKKISVQIESGVTTAAMIKNKIEAFPAAHALVGITALNGSNTQTAEAEDYLEGGDGLTLGTFGGVVGVSSTDDAFLEAQAILKNRSAFHTTSGNKAKNMFYAFGKLLGNVLNWKNQQYIEMPFADDVDELGEAVNLFDLKINFVITDAEYAYRLGLFASGGKAIVAPYIKKNLEIDMQSATLSFISGNQPDYTLTEAGLLEETLQKVIQLYIDRGWITAGVVEVKLEQSNFVASGYINISEPKALWRMFGEIRQTL